MLPVFYYLSIMTTTIMNTIDHNNSQLRNINLVLTHNEALLTPNSSMNPDAEDTDHHHTIISHEDDGKEMSNKSVFPPVKQLMASTSTT